MKQRASRLLSALLVLCMLSALLPGTALAANSDFVIENGVLTAYTGSGGTITVPDGVTDIGDYAFMECGNLTSVTIPSSVENVGQYAFSQCENLTSIIVASGNRAYLSVDGVLFSYDETLLHTYPAGKSDAAYSIPSSVASIGNSAFSWCKNLTSVTIPSSVTIIGGNAFWYCGNLTSVTIPDSVISIGDYAFYECSSLTDVKIPSSVTSIGESVFEGCGSITSVTIPKSVTSIGELAFLGVPVTSVIVPNTVTRIGELALGYDLNAEPVSGFTVFGDAGTAAEQYAKDNGFKFIPATGTAYPTTQGTVTIVSTGIDGGKKEVTFQMYALKDASGKPTNYVKIRDLALEMNGTEAAFAVGWDSGVVNLITGSAYEPNGSEHSTPFSGERSYQLPANPTKVNGKDTDLQAFVLTDDTAKRGQYTYYQLRDLGRMLGFNVGWSAERGIYIEPGKPYTDLD